MVYDTKVTGLAYGTLVNFIAIARFMNANNVVTNLHFVESDVILHDGTDDQDEINQFIDSSIIYARELLRSEITKIDRITSKTLDDNIHGWSNDYLLFDEFTRNRRPFFRDCFNVFNYLIASAEPHVQSLSLYSPNDFASFLPDSFRGTPYVSWACRYSRKGGDLGRQTRKDEFRKIYWYLRRRFPQCRILIVSDAVGCKHYSSLANELEIEDILFSKDYFTDFLGDASLVMNSQYFFSFRAGGIGQIPLLSRIPFEVLSPLMNEIPWDKDRLTFWQTKSQTFVVLKKHQFEDDRDSDLAKLGFQELSHRGGLG